MWLLVVLSLPVWSEMWYHIIYSEIHAAKKVVYSLAMFSNSLQTVMIVFCVIRA